MKCVGGRAWGTVRRFRAEGEGCLGIRLELGGMRRRFSWDLGGTARFGLNM